MRTSATLWPKTAALTTAIALLSGCASPLQRAESQAEAQRLNTPVEVLVTTPPFNEAQAKQAMMKGGSTIKGVLYHKIVNGGKSAGADAPVLSMQRASPMAGVTVWPYPATDHIQEVMRLTEENTSQRRWSRTVQYKHFVGDSKLGKYALKAQTDEHGLFRFTQMRPGRYLLWADRMNVISNGSETHFEGMTYQTTGAIVSSYGVMPIASPVIHTSTENFRVKTPVQYGGFVDVPSDNTVVEVDARMRRE